MVDGYLITFSLLLQAGAFQQKTSVNLNRTRRGNHFELRGNHFCNFSTKPEK